MEEFGQLKKKQMRNLIVSTLLIMLSFTGFSQTVIDSTSIRLTEPVAKLVIKDLVTGDAAIKEGTVLNDIIAEKNTTISKKDTIISNLNLQILNFNKAISLQDEKFSTSQKLSKELETALKKSKRQTKLYKIGTIVGGVAVGILILKD